MFLQLLEEHRAVASKDRHRDLASINERLGQLTRATEAIAIDQRQRAAAAPR